MRAVDSLLALVVASLPLCAIAADTESDQESKSEAAWASALPEMVGKSDRQLNVDHGNLLWPLLEKASWPFRPAPIRVWHFTNAADEGRYLVLGIAPSFDVPSNSFSTLWLFAEDGSQLAMWRLGAGWRARPLTVELKFDKTANERVLTVTSYPIFADTERSKQVYSVSDDSVRVLRLEDRHGVLKRNIYRAPNLTLGKKLPKKTRDRWFAQLVSDDLADRLDALTYITGEHLDPDKVPEENTYRQPIEEAKHVADIRNDPAARRAIEAYQKSENSWLKEAADLAASVILGDESSK